MSDAYDIVHVHDPLSGKTFRAGRRTAAAIEVLRESLGSRYGLYVVQSCYHTGVAASAGTHDKDCVLDFEITGLSASIADWYAAQKLLRSHGWASWFRHTGEWAARGEWHLHSVLLPGTSAASVAEWTRHVGIYVPGQRTDYYNHAFGLAGEHAADSDTSWHPSSINSTIFNYPAWQEAQMPLNSADKAWIEQTIAKYVGDVVPWPTAQNPKNTIRVSTALSKLRELLSKKGS